MRAWSNNIKNPAALSDCWMSLPAQTGPPPPGSPTTSSDPPAAVSISPAADPRTSATISTRNRRLSLQQHRTAQRTGPPPHTHVFTHGSGFAQKRDCGTASERQTGGILTKWDRATRTWNVFKDLFWRRLSPCAGDDLYEHYRISSTCRVTVLLKAAWVRRFIWNSHFTEMDLWGVYLFHLITLGKAVLFFHPPPKMWMFTKIIQPAPLTHLTDVIHLMKWTKYKDLIGR